MKKTPSRFEKYIASIWQLYLIIILLFLYAGLVFFAGYMLYLHTSKMPQDDRNNLIVLYTCVVGSFFTLFGVIITLIGTASLRKSDVRRNNRPIFFIPSKYDIAVANKIKFVIKDSKTEEIPNKNLYFQNSDKTAFIIESIKIDDSVFFPHSRFVEKGQLFCLSFFTDIDFDTFLIKINSLDGLHYQACVSMNDSSVAITKEV